jgi:hypothetical protein
VAGGRGQIFRFRQGDCLTKQAHPKCGWRQRTRSVPHAPPVDQTAVVSSYVVIGAAATRRYHTHLLRAPRFYVLFHSPILTCLMAFVAFCILCDLIFNW